MFVLSASGGSVLVHEKPRRRNAVGVAASSGIHEGEIVSVGGALRHDSLDASEVESTGTRSSGISLEGAVQSIDTAARMLSVSAGEDDRSGAAVVVQVPGSFDLGAFTVGEPVQLTVTRSPDGTYTLERSSDDASAAAADDVEDMQGEDGGEHASAARQCAAQQADPAFSAAHGGLTFTQVYERDPNDAANAFGRCVNLTAHQRAGESPSDGSGSHEDGSGTSTPEGSDASGSTTGAGAGGADLAGSHDSQPGSGSDG